MKIISDKIKEKYIGLIKENNLGQQMKVIDYHGCNEIYVKFNDGTIVKCSSNNFNKGSVRNYNFPSDIGYQRKNCMCYAGKTELLKHKSQCSHECLYCYWKA